MKEEFLSSLSNFSQIRPFQFEGVRFLRQQYRTNTGAILSDERNLGKKTQVVLFLSGLLKSEHLINILVIGDSENFITWKSLFNTWASFLNLDANVTFLDISDDNNHITKSWNILILDNLEISTIKQINNIKCKFKIWLTSKDLLKNVTEFYKILNFVTKDSIGKLREFEHAYKADILDIDDVLKKRILLDAFSRKWLLRRTKNILRDQLPFDNIDINEMKDLNLTNVEASTQIQSVNNLSRTKELEMSDVEKVPQIDDFDATSTIVEEKSFNIEQSNISDAVINKEIEQKMEIGCEDEKICLKRPHSAGDELESSSPVTSPKKGHFLNTLFDEDEDETPREKNVSCSPRTKFKVLDDILFNK